MIGTSEPWSVLRALRANPPGRAASVEARGVVFAAALEQAEQFLTAAASVGYATKPVHLFYALLANPGRAIAAVLADDPWDIRGHGASVKESDEIATTSVQADGKPRGALELVARATGSELWEGPVALGALWASLPELPDDAGMIGSAHSALKVESDPTGVSSTKVRPRRVVNTTAGMTLLGPSVRVGLRFADPPSDPEERRALHRARPRALPYRRRLADRERLGHDTMDPRPSPILIEWWKTENGQRIFTVPEILTEEHDGTLYFCPGLGENCAVPSRLIRWWGVLLGLSSLARYQPVAWRRALDIDHSPIAWALERGLRIAEERIPELVLRAVTHTT